MKIVRGVRKKFFRCFYAGDDVDGDALFTRKFHNKFLDYKEGGDSVGSSDGDVKIVPSSFLTDGGEKKSLRKRSSQKFSRVLKQMLILSLHKKLGGSKSMDTRRAKLKENASYLNDGDLSDCEELTRWSRSSASSSLFTNSGVTSAASSTCTSRSTSERKKTCPIDDFKAQPSRTSILESDLTRIYILVVGLLVLLIWGKAFATLGCTLWLFFAPPRRYRSLQNPVIMELDYYPSQESKKRVIITEGLLGKNRNNN